MEELRRLMIDNEDWLMQRILHYAKEQDYVRYTSTLAEKPGASPSPTSLAQSWPPWTVNQIG